MTVGAPSAILRRTLINRAINMATKQNPADAIKALAESKRVSIKAACDHAGMATSTLGRWKAGSVPRDGQVEKLKAAITELSANRKPCIKEAMRDMKAAVRKVERAVAAE